MFVFNKIAVVCALNKNCNKLLTNNQGALDFLQDEAGLVGEFSTLSFQHACQPVLSQHIIFHPQLKKVLQNILHRLVLLQAAHMVKQNLKKRGKNWLSVSDLGILLSSIRRLDSSSDARTLHVFIYVAAVTIELQVSGL